MKQLLIYSGGRYIPCEQNVQIEHIPEQNFEGSRSTKAGRLNYKKRKEN